MLREDNSCWPDIIKLPRILIFPFAIFLIPMITECRIYCHDYDGDYKANESQDSWYERTTLNILTNLLSISCSSLHHHPLHQMLTHLEMMKITQRGQQLTILSNFDFDQTLGREAEGSKQWRIWTHG